MFIGENFHVKKFHVETFSLLGYPTKFLTVNNYLGERDVRPRVCWYVSVCFNVRMQTCTHARMHACMRACMYVFMRAARDFARLRV